TWIKLTAFGESVKISTGIANGSTATVTNNVYKFVGWYSDKACTNKVGDNATYVPTKTDGTLWIDGTTYYAKFEYNLTSLTINKQGWDSNDADQTFLFKLMDASGKELTMVAVHENGSITIEGLTVGETYKIVELTNWSWRYSYDGIDNDKTTVSVTDTVIENGAEFTLNPTGNVITFNNTRPKEQWLDGNSYEVNIFDGKAN
ncbi:MAG: hypothetical protein IJZ84_05380, partial [Lachnospiraceae bacterium]|nr:hypothetical protein [Lachnospiraceae bacterium]